MDRSAGLPIIEVRILGSLEVWLGGRPVALGGLKQRSVLVLLALEANRVVPTDRLVDQIWPDAAGPAARHRLEVGVSNLRRILGAAARIESRAGGYVLNLEEDELDLHRYTRLVNAARAARAHGDVKLAAAGLREALDVWRGPPLADFTYESFASAHIERLSEERLGVLEDRIDADLDLGRHARVVAELADLVAEHPLRERLRGQLMVALFRCGRQAEALTAYASGREFLLDQLGVEPSPMLKDLERAILDHDPALDAPAHIADVRGAVDSQSLRLAERTAAGNLPAQLTSFVGRERELAEIRGLLGSARLVTLTGPGGSGKTRLALQVAGARLRDFGDGVWLADLSPLADATLVAATVAGALGVREDAAKPMIEVLVDAVRDRHMLVVIDNCEHVIEAAAQIADAVLRCSPDVSLLATSREPLRVSGEHVYRVPSLVVPAADESDLSVLASSDAVRLFAERVTQHDAAYAPDEATVASIARVCRRLDGIPLAIELAAARLRSVSLDELESRLDHRFRVLTGGDRTALPRQRTLRALIDWSWDLLNEAERAVLARAALFAGSWDLGAAEAVVAGTDMENWEVLDVLGALVDKSLVQVHDASGSARYRLLETVRDYASERLVERGDGETASAAHRDHFLALAEHAAPHLTAHGQTEWLDRLERDHDNLRAALAYSLIDTEPVPGLRLGVALQWFWQFRGPTVEGAEILSALLGRPDAQEATLMRGRALAVLGALLIENGNAETGSSCGLEALTIARTQSDGILEAQALTVISWAAFRRGEFTGALALADQGLAAARLHGDVDVTTRLLNARGIILGLQGLSPEARGCFQEARDLCRQSGNTIRVTALLNNLGYFALAVGEFDVARVDLAEALDVAIATRDPAGANAAFNLGLLALFEEKPSAARELFVQALSTARRAGDRSQVAYAILGLALTAQVTEQAITVHGVADAFLDDLGETYEVVELRLRALSHTRLRERFGDAAFDEIYQAGRNLRREEAIAIALQ